MNKIITDLFDEYLNIRTEVEQKDSRHDRNIYFNYGATEYSFLEELFKKYPFSSNDHLIDFGCGKGRVLIMAAYYSCRFVTGYELDVDRYKILSTNIVKFQNKFQNKSVFTIFNQNVENAYIDDTVTKFFFFEPFHLKIYIKILNAIKKSILRKNRNILIFLYNPFESTVKYINTLDYLTKIDMKECCNTINGDECNYYEYVIFTNSMLCE